MDPNPYSSPLQIDLSTTSEARLDVVDFTLIIHRWERLRIFYNLALLAVTILVAAVSGAWQNIEVVVVLSVFGAGFANFCFFLGPSLDGYLKRFGFRHPLYGQLIFWSGTLLAMLLAAASVASV